MRIFKITEKPTMGAMGIQHSARKVLVQWDDGSQQEFGVPDCIKDVMEYLSGGNKKIMSWKEIVPRSNKPAIPPN